MIFIANILPDVGISEWSGQTAELLCFDPVETELLDLKTKSPGSLSSISAVWSSQVGVTLQQAALLRPFLTRVSFRICVSQFQVFVKQICMSNFTYSNYFTFAGE